MINQSEQEYKDNNKILDIESYEGKLEDRRIEIKKQNIETKVKRFHINCLILQLRGE